MTGSPDEQVRRPPEEVPSYPIPRCPGFDPPSEFDRMRVRRPVAPVSLRHGQQAWLVTRYEDVRRVLRDHERFSSDPSQPGYPQLRPVIDKKARPGSFLVTDPPLHTKYRRMLTGEFTARRMRALVPEIERIVDGCLEDLLASPRPADFLETFALPIPAQVICQLLGVPYADREFFVSRSRTHTNRSLPAGQVRAALRDLEAYLDKLLVGKAREPAEDLLSRLAVERVRTGELEREEAVGMAVLLLIGGHETTANSLSLSTLALLEHPEQWAVLVADPGLVDNAVEELLRYLSVVHQGVVRAVRADIELGGQTVRAGEGVIASLFAANRDASEFPDPARLDVRREARSHIAFGTGVHQCVGQLLARVEMQVALRALVRKVPQLRPAVPLHEVSFRFDAPIYGVHSLPMTW